MPKDWCSLTDAEIEADLMEECHGWIDGARHEADINGEKQRAEFYEGLQGHLNEEVAEVKLAFKKAGELVAEKYELNVVRIVLDHNKLSWILDGLHWNFHAK